MNQEIIQIRKDTVVYRDTVKDESFVVENSRLVYVLVCSGCANNACQQTRQALPEVKFELNGKASEVLCLFLIVGKGRDSIEFSAISEHKSQLTKAHFYSYACMFDKSCLDFKGNIIIPKKGQLADAFLKSKTLLLSDEVRARTVPSLEIEADDVKAGHSASIGKVDEDLLFYLTSRGMNKAQATKLIVEGFYEELIAKIPDEMIQKKARQSIKNLISRP